MNTLIRGGIAMKGTSLKRTVRLTIYAAAAVLLAARPAPAQNYGFIESSDGSIKAEQQEMQERQEMQQMPPQAGEQAAPQQQLHSGVLAYEGSSTYTLGPTDIIEISVLRHPEVSGEYLINNEGKIQYEFVGDIEIAGLTKEEAKELIVDQLSTYIISPEVTLKITGYNSKLVYVYGEVAQPGKIFMRGDTITVREALLASGLPLLSASTKKGKLITPSEDGKPEEKTINIHALLYEGDLRENLVMRPGDTLYVPPTFLSKTMRAIQPITAPVSNAAGTGRSLQGF